MVSVRPSTIAFGGTIAGVKDTTINASAKNVNIANATAFKGKFNQTDGTTTIAGDKYFGGTVSVDGGTLAVTGAWTPTADTTLNGGTLQTAGSNIFTKGDDGKYSATTGWGDLTKTKGTLELSDTDFEYTLEQYKAAQTAVGDKIKLILNGTLKSDKPLKDGDVDGVTSPDLTVEASTAGKIGVTHDTTVGKLDFKAADGTTDVTITTGSATLTLTGNGGDVFANMNDTVKTVDASTGSIALGTSEESKGVVNVETLKVKDLIVVGDFDAQNTEVANLTVTGDLTAKDVTLSTAGSVTGSMTADKLSGAGSVSIGNSTNAGKLEVKKLDLTGLVFLDPAWSDGSTVADASSLAVTDLTTPVAAKLVAGQNSIVSLGAATAVANQAFESIAHFNPLAWSSTSITAAAYVDAPVDLASTGLVYVDGSLTAAPTTGLTAGTVTVNKDGMLIVNQQNVGNSSVFTVGGADNATVAFADGSYLGVVNTTEGSFKLAKTVTGTANVVTDNQFFNASVKGEVLTTTVDTKKLAGAVASMGVQQMARRADTVFANTIADRTAQSVAGEGVALWVDVGGERYEADDLDNGAQE